MKKVKFNFGILAIILGLTAAFAFKAPAVAKAKPGNVWYSYTLGADKTKPASYTRIPDDPGCDDSVELCAIEGPDNGTHPSQSTVNHPLATEFQP